MFGFGKKYCYTCGMGVNRNQYQRFGKSFCSEEHAQQYTEQMQKARQEQLAQSVNAKHGGCC